MRSMTITAALACLGLAASPVLAAEKHNGRAGQGMRAGAASAQDSMTDQLNAQSLARAQAGQNSPTPGPDSTGNLNRMSDQDAMKGRGMNSAPMPFR